MIRVHNTRQVLIEGVEPMVMELHPGGLIRVRRKGTRTWYETTAGAVFWLGAKAEAEAVRKERVEKRRLRRASRAS